MCCCTQLHQTLWTVARQVPMSMGFSRLEYRSGLLFPPSGDLPDPGIKPASPALTGEFFTSKATWETSKQNKDFQNMSSYKSQKP